MRSLKDLVIFEHVMVETLARMVNPIASMLSIKYDARKICRQHLNVTRALSSTISYHSTYTPTVP